MKNKLLLLFFLLGVFFPLSAQESEVLISTSHTSLLLSTSQGGELKFLYYGRKLTDADVHAIVSTESGSFSAYPVYGLNCPSESALSVQQTSLVLVLHTCYSPPCFHHVYRNYSELYE